MEYHHDDPAHLVKKVVLPSGKTIEVVSYEQTVAPAAPVPHAAPDTAGALHICLECGSKLAYPIAWEEAGDDHWAVTIRCPECETYLEGVFAQDAVEAFDEELDLGTDVLMADYRRLMRANMAEEVDRFAGALHAGAVLPEDF